MQVTLFVEIIDRVRQLQEIFETLAVKVPAAGFDEEVQAHPLDPFHHDERLAGGRHAELEGLDDVRVAKGHADGALGRPVHSGEARLELGGFLFVQDFQADGSGELFIVSPVDL